MDLILWRHAEAREGSPDLTRPLTRKGCQQAKEMAEFLMKLYDSDKTVGIVDIQTYEFKLTDPVFNFRQSQTEKH